MKAFLKISFLVLSTAALVLATFHYQYLAKHDFRGRSSLVAKQEAPPESGKLILKAPDSCEIGELVRLDLRESNVDGIIWKVLPETADFEIIDEGRRALFSSRVPGTYTFLIAGAKGGTPYLIYHSLPVNGGVGPSPGPLPAVSLEVKVSGWVKKVADYPARKQHLAGMAGVFKKMAEAPDVKVEQILEATALANTAVLGADLQKWVPFLDELGKELDAMVAAKTLTTREQYKAAWLEIATALEKSSK